jgi:hypothetical protein
LTAVALATVACGQSASTGGGAPSCGGPGAQTFADAQKAHPDSADYIAIDIDQGQTSHDVRDFLTSAGAPGLAIATDPQGALMTAYAMAAEGTTIVVDPHGNTVYTGVLPPAEQIANAVTTAGKVGTR